MKKYIVCFMMFFLCIVIGCEIGASPKDVLNIYLDASLKGRYEEAYSFISSADKKTKNLTTYLAENDKKDNPFAQAYVNNMSFKILNVTKTGDKATAEVEITMPDFSVMFKDIMGAAFESAFGGKDNKKIGQAMAEKYKNGEVPLTTKKEKYNLVKDADGWKVFFDWETETKIQTLLTEAKELKKAKKLHGALEKYERILELDSEMVEAKTGVEETTQEIQTFEEKQKYIKNVELYDLKSRYYDTYLDKKVPGVEFKLKNKGNRSLKEVEVTVYFKDAKGTIIAEKTYYPVLVTRFSFSGDKKPLKPNYIWQLERDKFYKADAVPNEWKEGSVSAKITNIEFEE